MISRILKPSKTQSFFLFGPRGSGKSTLLKDLFKQEDVLWIDLLDQHLDFELTQNPEMLIKRWQVEKPKWIVIDEVQKNPKLLDVVHRSIESFKIKFALTGSSSRKLKAGSANLLAGRAASYNLSGFSSLELEADFNLNKALSVGLLPRLWSEELTPADQVRSMYAYVQTYLKEEVAAEQLVRMLDPFRRFLVVAAQSNGKIINYAKIERDANLGASQAEKHFEILQDTLIGHALEPYHQSIRKRQSQKSKFYFFDTGVVRALSSSIQDPIIESTFEYGNLFESFLINEFFKLNECYEKHWKFSYLRTKDDVEVDLIIEKTKGPPILIEIKSTSSRIALEEINRFNKIAKEFPKSQKIILCRNEDSYEEGDVQIFEWKKGLKKIFELD
jgi:predicted AAA+ superfamily ATPase